MTMNYDIADKMAVMNTSKRQELDKKGLFGRAAALVADGAKSDADKRQTPNAVAEEMKALEAVKEYEPVWEQLEMAVRAARESCQKAVDGVESKKERNDKLVKILNDLIAVTETVRDNLGDVIAERSPEEKAHPELVA